MQNSEHYPEEYSISVKTVNGLFQRFLIRRSKSGDVYFNFLGSEPEQKPHSSYHQSGATHHKTSGHKIFQAIKQPPTHTFTGTENILTTVVIDKDVIAINSPCERSKFTDVMEIPESLVNMESGRQLSIDIVEPGIEPWISKYPYGRII